MLFLNVARNFIKIPELEYDSTESAPVLGDGHYLPYFCSLNYSLMCSASPGSSLGTLCEEAGLTSLPWSVTSPLALPLAVRQSPITMLYGLEVFHTIQTTFIVLNALENLTKAKAPRPHKR